MMPFFFALLLDGPPQVSPLPRASVEALQILYEDECRAEALYAAVIAKHGEVRPFINIIEAERRHQDALLSLYKDHHLPVPMNPWKDKTVKAPDAFKASCEAGITAEEENVALYDRLLPTVREPDLLEVFKHLRWASQERHLPAFRRHAARATN